MNLDLLNLIDKNTKKIAVGVSGGCDSLALTFLLQDFCQNNNIELEAISVDHKVRPTSTSELNELHQILINNKISHHILNIADNIDFSKNIEANMRKVRYELLYDFCQTNQIKYLFLGHHIGDVAENFLIRLFRGSSLDGLSPIKEVSNYKNIKLIRPLLNIKKQELKDYLTAKNISWFEDESNNNEKFLRNKIRNFLSSFEEEDLIINRIKNSSEEISEIRDLFDDEMLEYAKEIIKFENKQQLQLVINIDRLFKIDEKYALKILSLSFQEISGNDYKPRLAKLKDFYKDLKNSNIRDFYGCKVVALNAVTIIITNENAAKLYPKTILSKLLS